MKWIRAFGLFWYDFVVGDDWLLAVGVIVALGVTAILAHMAKVPSWWLLPVVVLFIVAFSVLRASRKIIRRMPTASSQAEAAPVQEQPLTD
ncbi:MAG TPA: hypothetical protein VND62_04020 [Acidimicrobiales bacterium]|nr:hypothetical protein [Acidimicrobiales bacterium]